jgi:Uma2 family endonuclease
MNASLVPDARVRMNVEEFLAWSARQPDHDCYELVEGEVVAMTRDTVVHNRTKGAVYIALLSAVRAAGLPCEVFIDGIGVAINEKSLRIPDVIVQCGAGLAPNAMLADAPVIAVEVVSPSSERDDVDTKFLDYFSVASIRHYLIVFSEKRVVIHHHRDEGGKIESTIVSEGEIVLDPPGFSVSVAALLGS